MKTKRVWIVEYNWSAGWEQTPDDEGAFISYNTKRNAYSDLAAGKYSGHPQDLRVSKYVREEK